MSKMVVKFRYDRAKARSTKVPVRVFVAPAEDQTFQNVGTLQLDGEEIALLEFVLTQHDPIDRGDDSTYWWLIQDANEEAF